jgi:hypothetical protein
VPSAYYMDCYLPPPRSYPATTNNQINNHNPIY